MKLSLILALSAFFTYTNAQVGPIHPEQHPATSLREAVHRMRLSLDRELLYLARLEAQAEDPSNNPTTATTTRQTAAETVLDEDDGFTEMVNDGKSIFRPILPGVRVPAANEFADTTPMPSDGDPTETTVPAGAGDGVPPMPSESDDPTEPVPSMPPSPGRPEPSPGALPPTVTPTPIVGTPPVGGVDPSPTEGLVDDSPPPIPPPFESGTPQPMPSDDDTIPPSEIPMTPIPGSTSPPPVNGAEGGPSATPDSTPAGEDDDDAVCFPADASVELEDGSVKAMADVQLGDRVKVGPEHFSDVFMFTHKLAQVRHRFVHIHTQSGHSLALTKGHYLYVNGVTAAASTVKVGDSVMLADHSISVVTMVDEVIGRGLFNPQTVHGDIVVNGVRATTYTRTVERRMAHALLAPLRAAFVSAGWSLSAFDEGADRLASLVPSGSLF